MEQSEIASQSEAQAQNANYTSAVMPSTKPITESALIPQQTLQPYAQASPQGVDMMSPPLVYTIGEIDCRPRTLSVEKEIAQATAQSGPLNLTDRQAFYAILSKPENRYLLRHLCWVFRINGMDTYLLQPRDPADFNLLVEAIHPERGPSDVDVVIGIRGPIAPADMCNGLMVPIVGFDQLYSFSYEAFIQAVPRPSTIPEDQDAQFRAAVREVFDRIRQRADNLGATDEDRAVNYLAVRDPAIYARAAEMYLQNASLTGISVQPSLPTPSNTRTIMDVIFSFTNRQTNVVDMFRISVDVTEEFPFLVRSLSPYFAR